MNYEYEPIEGRRTRVYTANSDIRYGYDLLGRISTVTVMKRDGAPVNPPEVTINTYTALGSLQDVYYPNGVHAYYQYDVMNRLTSLAYTNSGGTMLAQYIYAPNTNGQWKTATEVQRQSDGTYSTSQFVWSYDNLGRLTNETCSSTLTGLSYTNRYVYNLVGNRLWLTNIVGAVTTAVGYTYNDNDQLITDGTFINWYDANGSLINRSSADETNGYAFNLQNRLASATINRLDGGQLILETVNYTYDYRGNRVRSAWTRNVGGNGTNIFLYEPNSPSGMSQVLEELPAVGATPTVSYTLGTRVMSQGKGGTISHLISDGHGSTRQLVDANGNITARYTYDAYGQGLDFANDTQGSTATALLYCGGRHDLDLQQYPLGPRCYNPATGRFNQIDPFSGNQQSGANLYAYCGGDPVNNSDPSGLYDIDVHRYLTEFLAEKAKFDHDDAVAIGRADMQVDVNNGAGFGLWPPYAINNRDWHFIDRSRVLNLANGIKGKTDPNYLNAIGDFLHAQEDSYAHCKGVLDRDWVNYGGKHGGLFGHGGHGHYPDFTFWRPEKAMKMAQRVYADLKHINLSGGRYNDDPGEALKNDAPALDPAMAQTVKTFLEFPEKPDAAAGSGAYVTETFTGINLTRQSMLNKIRLLYPGLPDPITNDPQSPEAGYLHDNFSDVAGHKFGTHPSYHVPKGGEIMMGVSPSG